MEKDGSESNKKDNIGKTCVKCGEGTYVCKDADDAQGILHCSKCNYRVGRYDWK